MNKKLPSIDLFIDFIDPNNKLDITKVLSDIVSVAMLESIERTLNGLSEKQKSEIKKYTSIESNIQLDKALAIFEEAGKTKHLRETLKSVTDEVKTDYLKNQFKALNTENKKRVLQKFPSFAQFD